MIYAYTGKTGSGKTYNMAIAAYKRWRRGEDIYTNTLLTFVPEELYNRPLSIRFHPSLFSRYERLKYFVTLQIKKIEWCNEKFNLSHFDIKRGKIQMFEEVSEILEVRDGVIFIDEGQSLFEARNWESLPDEFSNKLRQHRKHCLDLYVTTQNLGTIDINYRRLVQKWIHCERVFQLGKSPRILFGMFRKCEKDIDELYNQVDDLKVTTIKSNIFFIHRWSRVLYDTMYDVGFKRFKIVWLEQIQEGKLKRKFLIIPRKMSLSNARTELLLSTFFLDPNKSKGLKTT